MLQQGQRFLYYLVTKDRFYHKPLLYNVRSSLLAMREHMLVDGAQQQNLMIQCDDTMQYKVN